ncbi:MAG: hypothetical protein CVV02_01625 [Firmicutes bacterium HGW-Firmicutes-7]|nr:MAG: hypothetical protein CVV02_01625 [Firmicutes bacterium HGW-Firmicutes-7]
MHKSLVKVFHRFAAFMVTVLSLSNTAYAVSTSKIVTGTQSLLQDVGTALIVLAIPAGIATTIYCFIRRGAADEMDHSATCS